MIVEMTLPRLGETMDTGRVAAWLKKPGDAFRRGETLIEIETDKTVVEMPALANGVLTEIIVPAGKDADVGAVLCRYDDGLEASASALPYPVLPDPDRLDAAQLSRDLPSSPLNGPDLTAPVPNAATPAVALAGPADASKPRATPLARAAARQGGIDLGGVTGTGRRGRVEAADVHAALGTVVPAAMRNAAVPAGLVACRDWAGDASRGSRIVLLHGLAADVQSWAQLAPALARMGRHVTAIDLPGHGGTAIDALGLDALVDTAAAFLQGLGGEPVELVGHSMGGAVAARVARVAPSRVRRVTLVAPAGLDRAIDVSFVRGIVRAQGGGLQHLLRRLVVRPAALTAAQLEALAAELGRGRLHALADSLVDEDGQIVDITGDLRALPMPVRVVWGLQDQIIPWTQVKEVGSRVAVHLIADAGHVPHWDQPAEVAALFD